MRFLTTVLLLLLAVSCRQAARDTVARADMLLSDQPDSALALLEGLDFHRLHGRRLRAHYALTHTVALDKNYIDSDNDSLFRYAFDYYSRHRDDSLRSLAHYYRGRLYQNGTQYQLATESYLTALHHLDTTRSHYRTGLVYSRLGEMYRDQYNFNSALDYFHRALDAYTSARAEVARYMTMGELGNVYCELRQFDKSRLWIEEALCLSRQRGDDLLAAIFLNNLLIVSYEFGYYDESLVCYEKLVNLGFSVSSTSHLCIAGVYLERDDDVKAVYHIRQYEEMSDSSNSALYYFLRYKLSASEGDWKSAELSQSHFLFKADSLYRKAVASMLPNAEKAFYAERLRFTNYRNKVNNVLFCVGISLAVALLFVLIYYYRSRLRRNESEMYTYMATIQTMQEELALRKKTSPTTTHQVQYQNQIREFLAAHFAIMDDLCLAFFEHSTTKEQQRHIFNSVKERLNTLRDNKKGRRQLEKMVNATCNNLIVRLRQQMPQFTDDDIHFILLTCAGFSPQVLSLVFEKTLSQIYARKRRLKDRVRASQVADKEEFLLFLS